MRAEQRLRLAWPVIAVLTACDHETLPKGNTQSDAGFYEPNEIVTCFARGTPIATPAGDVRIEEIRPGDWVLAYDFDRRRVVPAPVVEPIEHALQPVMHLRTPTGVTLAVTPNHPIYSAASGGFQAAGDLAGSVIALALNSGLEVIEALVEPFPATTSELASVHNLTVAGLHNYFAGGILVHNKTRCGYRGDPPDCPCSGDECAQFTPRDAGAGGASADASSPDAQSSAGAAGGGGAAGSSGAAGVAGDARD